MGINHLKIIHYIALADGGFCAKLDAETKLEIEVDAFEIAAVHLQSKGMQIGVLFEQKTKNDGSKTLSAVIQVEFMQKIFTRTFAAKRQKAEYLSVFFGQPKLLRVHSHLPLQRRFAVHQIKHVLNLCPANDAWIMLPPNFTGQLPDLRNVRFGGATERKVVHGLVAVEAFGDGKALHRNKPIERLFFRIQQVQHLPGDIKAVVGKQNRAAAGVGKNVVVADLRGKGFELGLYVGV